MAFGWTVERKTFGSKDFEWSRTADPARSSHVSTPVGASRPRHPARRNDADEHKCRDSRSSLGKSGLFLASQQRVRQPAPSGPDRVEENARQHSAADEPERVVLIPLGRPPHFGRPRRPRSTLCSRRAKEARVARVAFFPLCLCECGRAWCQHTKGRGGGESEGARTGASVERP